jgi:dUTP pyrophosphatase
MKIRFSSLYKKLKFPFPEYQTQGSSGMDLYACIEESLGIKPFERILIPSGIFLEIPSHLEGQIRTRSGIAFKKGLVTTGGIGTIDSDYRGELLISLINMDKNVQTIEPGDRLAQLIFAPIEKVVLEEVEELDHTVRQQGGFGSTGISL